MQQTFLFRGFAIHVTFLLQELKVKVIFLKISTLLNFLKCLKAHQALVATMYETTFFCYINNVNNISFIQIE